MHDCKIDNGSNSNVMLITMVKMLFTETSITNLNVCIDTEVVYVLPIPHAHHSYGVETVNKPQRHQILIVFPL